MSLAHQIAAKPSKLEQQKALLGGAKPSGIAGRAMQARDGGGLARYEAACTAIAAAKAVDEVKEIRNQAEALRAAARVAGNRQAEVDMAEVRIRAERRLGELMEDQRKAGAMNSGGRPSETGLRTNPVSAAPTLAEVGIDKNLADRARKYAAIPATEFEGILAERRDRFQQEDERVTVSLMEAGERHSTPATVRRFYDNLVALWCESPTEDREAFVVYLRVSGVIESPRKAAEAVSERTAFQGEGMCSPTPLVAPATGAAVAGVSGQPEMIPALTGQFPGANVSGPERAGVTAGETAPHSPSDGDAISEVKGKARPESAAGAEPPPSVPIKRKTAADYRPHCQRPEMCAASGLKHCHSCEKAIPVAESEAA